LGYFSELNRYEYEPNIGSTRRERNKGN